MGEVGRPNARTWNGGLSILTFNDETHEYFWNGEKVPYSVTGILKVSGLIDTTWYNEPARVRGTYVHEATQFLDEDCLEWDSLDPVITPYVEAYARFKTESKFHVKRIEEC